MTDKPSPTNEELNTILCAHWPAFAAQSALVKIWVRDAVQDAIDKWGQPAQAAEPVAWAATSEDGVVEALGMNQSRRFDTPLYLAPQSVVREPQWSPASTPPKESDGEVLVRMADGRCEIAWATYWHGSSNAFAQWTFRDPDEEETPVEWMLIPHGIKGGQHGTE